MRFADLNKLKAEPPRRPAPAPAPVKAPEPAPPPAPEPAEAPARAEPAAEKTKNGRRRAPGPRLFSSHTPEAAPQEEFSLRDEDARAREVYTRLVDQASAFLKAVDEPYCERYEALSVTCALVVDALRAGGALLNYTVYSTADDYLRAHTANTAILALAMGLQAGLDQEELQLLGFCALAHDIGMTEYSSLYNSEKRLAEDEFSELALHAEAGAAKLDRIVDLDYRVKERARRIVLQVHERADGSGYPDHVSSEELDPLAQYIGIADAYEALTHPRAWRDALNPPDAVRELIEKEGRGFNAGAVKLLLSVVSIFPPGSLVRLSTGEVARVLRVNRGSLTRPAVQVLLDGDFAEAAPELLDLRERPLISIERAVRLEELRDQNPQYAARLELASWWVDW